MMTSERRAELKDRWSGGAYEELFAEIDSLRAALREAQNEIVRMQQVVLERGKAAQDLAQRWAKIADNENERADALQRRVEELEIQAACRHHDEEYDPNPAGSHPLMRCRGCGRTRNE